MERLTRRIYLGIGATDDSPPYERRFVAYEDGNFIGHEARHMTVKEVQRCLNKLADYEDLDERGMVIRDGEPEKCFVNMAFDKSDLQKMVNEKVSEIELNIDKIKEQTINDFVAMFRKYTFSNEYGTHIVFTPEQLDGIIARWKAGGK